MCAVLNSRKSLLLWKICWKWWWVRWGEGVWGDQKRFEINEIKIAVGYENKYTHSRGASSSFSCSCSFFSSSSFSSSSHTALLLSVPRRSMMMWYIHELYYYYDSNDKRWWWVVEDVKWFYFTLSRLSTCGHLQEYPANMIWIYRLPLDTLWSCWTGDVETNNVWAEYIVHDGDTRLKNV